MSKERFGVAVNWPVGQKDQWVGVDAALTAKTGITRYNLYFDEGILFDYTLQISTNTDYDYEFYDETGDNYGINVSRTGSDHWVNYKSEHPTVVFIKGT
jgi:hypothetical protein